MFHRESPKMAPVLINKLDSVLIGLLDVEWLYVLKVGVIFRLSLKKSFDLVFY